jgi:hypothetical protein
MLPANQSFEPAPGIPSRRLDCNRHASPGGAPQLGHEVSTETAVLHPSQFQVNEAWIAFQLNELPIETMRDGSFNCVALMDAASCLILGNTFLPTTMPAPSPMELRRLLQAGWEHKRQYPTTLLVPKGQLAAVATTEATLCGIEVIPVEEHHLLSLVGDARQSFRDFIRARGDRET